MNLSPIQRIAVAEKYRPIYERLARENLRLAEGGDRRSKEYIKNQGVENLPQVDFSKKERNPTTSEKLSDIAGVSEKTYRMGAVAEKYRPIYIIPYKLLKNLFYHTINKNLFKTAKTQQISHL